MLPVRRILAMDIGLHGERFIVIEFTLVTLFAAALGLFELLRSDATPTYTLSGAGFMGVAANALTMLLLALAVIRDGDDRSAPATRMSTLTLWILALTVVPFAAPVAHLIQRRHG